MVRSIYGFTALQNQSQFICPTLYKLFKSVATADWPLILSFVCYLRKNSLSFSRSARINRNWLFPYAGVTAFFVARILL